jgi:hypothetical protein
MTDKELLERAAKAAGLPELRGAGSRHHCYYVIDEQPTRWNPLYDDGDAFRLAIKLGFVVETIRHQQTAVVRHKDQKVCVKWRSLVDSWTDETDAEADDEHEAARKAIVLAAAMIGEKE